MTRAIIVLIVIPTAVLAQTKIKVVGFSSTECNDGAALYNLLRTRIIEKKFIGGVFEIKIATPETCCLSFKPVVKYYSSGSNHGSDTLYLGYRTSDEACDCVCYYELTYRLQGLEKDNFNIRFKGESIEISDEKYKTYPIQFKLMGKDTVNFVDRYGMRQGLWSFDSLSISEYYVYENGIPMKRVVLFPNGATRIESTREHHNWNRYIEYYETGQKKMECFNSQVGESYKQKDGRCKEWDINGQLIYEGPFRY
jgi:hypothetical protein